MDQLIEYLVLYYCCFDQELWIPVFYPFIQVGIGTFECNMIFAKYDGHLKQVISLCNEMIEALTMNEKIKENILKERLLYNIFCENDDINNDATQTNPFDLIGTICIKFQENSNCIKTQVHDDKRNDNQ